MSTAGGSWRVGWPCEASGRSRALPRRRTGVVGAFGGARTSGWGVVARRCLSVVVSARPAYGFAQVQIHVRLHAFACSGSGLLLLQRVCPDRGHDLLGGGLCMQLSSCVDSRQRTLAGEPSDQPVGAVAGGPEVSTLPGVRAARLDTSARAREPHGLGSLRSRASLVLRPADEADVG